MGHDGTGVTVSILDGGPAWGHTDLIGAWLTGVGGWPQASDPFDTLVLLIDPSQVSRGLTWYTPTQQKTGVPAGSGTLKVTFATRTGPSRNFAAPDGTNSHDYTFPAAWSKSGKVMLGGHPDDYLLALYGERPAFLVTDPERRRRSTTRSTSIPDDDFSISATRSRSLAASPVSYRDLNGDGYTGHVGWGCLLTISGWTARRHRASGWPGEFGLHLVPVQRVPRLSGDSLTRPSAAMAR
jgi:hypothetical protein